MAKSNGSKVRRAAASPHTRVALKAGLTIAAFTAAAYSNMLGRRISEARQVELADETVPPELAGAMKRQAVMRWVTPALSGGLMVLDVVARKNPPPSSRLAKAVDRIGPEIDRLTPDLDRIHLDRAHLDTVTDTISDRLSPVLDRIGPAIERITPEWVEEHRLPSLAS